MEDKTRLLRLVRKLFRLSTSSNEHEAALALERARAIVRKYNLDLATTDERPAVESLEVGLPRSGWRWREILAGEIARANLCDGVIGPDNRRLWFVGRPENVAAVAEMDRWVASQLRQEARFATLEARLRRQWKRGWESDFLFGAALRIGKRLRDAGAGDPTGTALARTMETENLDYIQKQWGPTTRADKATFDLDSGAKARGWAAGASVPLGPPQRLEEGWTTAGSSRCALGN